MRLRDVLGLMAEWYDPEWAEDWDRVGLVCGDPDQEVRRVLWAVDPSPTVVAEALDWRADLLVCHHPLLLTAVSSVAATGPKGKAVHALVRGGTALLTAHTNADVAPGGVNESLARAVGLDDLTVMVPTDGAEPGRSRRGHGRLGRLPESTTLGGFADRVAAALPSTAHGVRVAGDPGRPVRRVAVAGGSGDFLLDTVLDLARGEGVDAFLTSDLRHHRAAEFGEHPDAPALLDVAHWAAEWTWLPAAEARLLATTAERGDTVETRVSVRVTDPWTFRAG